MSPNGQAVNIPGLIVRSANFPGTRLLPSNASTLYISGLTAKQLDGTFAGVRETSDGEISVDVAEQIRQALRNLDEIIKQADRRAGLANVVDVVIYLVDCGRNFDTMNAVWNEHFPSVDAAPTRATISTADLGTPKVMIELKCIAILPETSVSKI